MEENENNEEMGGLFHVAQRKKIHVNDQEDYTFHQHNDKQNWDLDEV